MGATLYCPATRPRLADDIVRRAAQGVVAIVVCLEDSVADHDLDGAERNAVAQLRELGRRGRAAADDLRPGARTVEQVPMLVAALGDHAHVLTGFVVPKFNQHNGAAFLDAVVAAGISIGRRLLVMPVLESSELSYVETRAEGLLATRRLLDKYRELRSRGPRRGHRPVGRVRAAAGA